MTGGTGALGARVARWAARAGAARLILVSRNGDRAPGAEDLRDELRDAGAEVTFAALDLTNRRLLHALLEAHPVDAVVHTAGVLEDGVLDGLTPAAFKKVFAAKVAGARNLDELTRNRELSAFILFSSFAGTVGSAGQANYAAANALLDALAERRRSEGLPATSIAWGPWAGGGMAADADAEVRQLRGGVGLLDPDRALDALAAAAGDATAAAFVADVDWSRFGAAFTAVRHSPFLAEVSAPRPDPRSRPRPSRPDSRRACAASPLRHACGNSSQRSVPGPRRHSDTGAEQVGAERAFRDLGVDSLIAVELRNVLASVSGLALPATVVFDHPTPQALAAFIHAELFGDGDETAGCRHAVRDRCDRRWTSRWRSWGWRAVSRVGWCRRRSSWELVADGGDARRGVPGRPWLGSGRAVRSGSGHPGTSVMCACGGFVRCAAEFDAEFFGISPREALAMDPQQRLLLEASWEALERAGMDPSVVAGQSVPVCSRGRTVRTIRRC